MLLAKLRKDSVSVDRNRMSGPNFFILGAPKCGTTSLANWLSEHPNIFISEPKEPKFFNTDWDLPNRPRTLKKYEQLFLDVSKEHLAIGEATTGYLSSKVAIPKILDYNPSSRFIVCLRNPIHMFGSLHAQRLKEGIETEPCIAKAWEKQGERRKGIGIPRNCTDYQTLLYGEICSLGSQVERLLELVEPSQVCFVLLDDLKVDPGRAYERILNFLEIEHDGRVKFPVVNKGSVPKRLWISQISRALGRLKKTMRINYEFGIQSKIRARNEMERQPFKVDPHFHHILISYFREDIIKLEGLINKNLSHWYM